MSKLIARFIAPCLLVTAYCSLLGGVGLAQTATATLSGVVEDQNKQVVPGAAITVQNRATSLERTATTNDSGQFTVQLLPPGTYSVTVRRDGFTAVEVKDVILNVGDQKSLSVQLKVGDVNAAIEVRPDVSLINTSPAQATTIGEAFVKNMPLNGRSFSLLVTLTPGITVATTSGVNAGQFSVNGQRPSTNYFTVDGVSANIGMSTGGSGVAQAQQLAGTYVGQSALGSTANLVSIDALQEFTIQTSTYSSEFGRQPGGQVQIITKSGTNDFHGTLFEYFRNEALDARNYFNKKPAPQTVLRQNQFGGTIGGPVYFPNFGDGGPRLYNGKNRTFFFFSYEGQRLFRPVNQIVQVPSNRLRARALAASSSVMPVLNAFPVSNEPELLTTTNCTPANPQPPLDPCDPVSRKIFSGSSNYNLSVSNPSNLDATSIRFDHSINSRHTLFGRYNDSPSDSVSLGVATASKSYTLTRVLTLGLNSFFGKGTTNEFRINFSRQQARSSSEPNPIDGAVAIDPMLLTAGNSGTGTGSFSVGTVSNVGVGPSADNIQRQFNIVDNFSFSTGAHHFKIGFDFRRLSPIYAVQNTTQVSFNTEADVVNGLYTTIFIRAVQAAYPNFDNYSSFVNDTWQVSKRLTLNLGVRWDVNPSPTEKDGKYPLILTGVTGYTLTGAAVAPPGTPFYKTIYSGFAPRFGLSYALNDKPGRETILRGGFGVFYDLGNGPVAGGWPITGFRSTALPGCSRAFPLTAQCAALPTITFPVSAGPTAVAIAVDPNIKLPYTLQWSLTLDQSLGKGQALSVAYVAAAGRRLLYDQLFNSATSLGRPSPNFSQVDYVSNGPSSDYDSMQVQYRARLGQSINAVANYTWSHAIDDVSSDIETGILERGDANFDVRHNFSAAINYNLPSFGSGLLETITRNWSLDAIAHAQSGRPINLAYIIANTVINNQQSVRLRPDLVPGVPVYLEDASIPGGRRFNPAAFQLPPMTCVPNPAGGPCVNFPVRQGTFGRNVLNELPLYQFDMALGRTIDFSEKFKLLLKAEVFNVFNHPMFGYGTFETDPGRPGTFGIPSTTLNNSLGGLNGLYQFGGPRSIQLSARMTF